MVQLDQFNEDRTRHLQGLGSAFSARGISRQVPLINLSRQSRAASQSHQAQFANSGRHSRLMRFATSARMQGHRVQLEVRPESHDFDGKYTGMNAQGILFNRARRDGRAAGKVACAPVPRARAGRFAQRKRGCPALLGRHSQNSMIPTPPLGVKFDPGM